MVRFWPACALTLSLISPSIDLGGAVKNPGPVVLKEPTALSKVLRDRGGLLPEGDAKKILVRSRSGSERVVDMSGFGQLVTLVDGDSVSVPKRNDKDYVFVSGGVTNGGAIPYRDGLDLKTLLAEARATPNAGVNHVKVSRSTDTGVEKTIVNLDAGANPPLIALMPGDKVEVPYSRVVASDRELLTIVVIGLLILILISR